MSITFFDKNYIIFNVYSLFEQIVGSKFRRVSTYTVPKVRVMKIMHIVAKIKNDLSFRQISGSHVFQILCRLK